MGKSSGPVDTVSHNLDIFGEPALDSTTHAESQSTDVFLSRVYPSITCYNNTWNGKSQTEKGKKSADAVQRIAGGDCGGPARLGSVQR